MGGWREESGPLQLASPRLKRQGSVETPFSPDSRRRRLPDGTHTSAQIYDGPPTPFSSQGRWDFLPMSRSLFPPQGNRQARYGGMGELVIQFLCMLEIWYTMYYVLFVCFFISYTKPNPLMGTVC